MMMMKVEVQLIVCTWLLVISSLFMNFAQSQSTNNESCPRCTPLCQNGDGSRKQCGNDGCGGSCGTCSFGQECCRGFCVCSPNCNGRNCGDDGCGGDACGQCSTTQTCINGQCSGTPTPTCTGRVCGSNRAGGSCGSCPTGQRCRTGQCECYYDCNERNCGPAIQAIGTSPSLCPSISCGSCPTGFTCGSNGLCSALTPCTITLRVLDCSTNVPVSVTSNVLISSSTLSYSSMITILSSVGSASWETPGLGSFNFQVTASGYMNKTETRSVTSSTTSIDLCLNRPTVPVTVVDCSTLMGLSVTSSILISSSSVTTGTTGTPYSMSLSVSPSGTSMWTIPGSGSFTFQTSATGYSTQTEVRTVSETTSSIQICLSRTNIVIRVLDCSTNVPLSTPSTVVISSGSYSTTLTIASSSSSSWSGAGFFGNFNFLSSATGYVTKSEVRMVTETTTNVDLCLNRIFIEIDVRERTTNTSISGTTTTINWSGQGSGSMVWSRLTSWSGTSSGYGTYSFTAVPATSTYTQGNLNNILISSSTTLIIIYVNLTERCGDDICTQSDWISSTNDQNACPTDCSTIYFWLEDAVLVQGVRGSTINFYVNQDPREYNDAINGPNKKQGLLPNHTITMDNEQAAQSVYMFGYDVVVYFEIEKEGYIPFYWFVNNSIIDSNSYWYIRVHLSPLFSDPLFNYRIVNSWVPDSAGFEAPTTLYSVFFWPDMTLNGFNTSNYEVFNNQGKIVGKKINANIQSGGPSTFDINPDRNTVVTIWNVKPNRNSRNAPYQYKPMVNSRSYFTIYGRTRNAQQGKQLSIWVIPNDSTSTSQATNNLWYAGRFSVSADYNDATPSLVYDGRVSRAPNTTTNDLLMNCIDYDHCKNYIIPYSNAK